MMRRATLALGTIAGLTLAAGGCGSGAQTSGTAGPGASRGERVFVDTGCGSCHTLKAAGSTGTAGPVLDGRDYDVAAVQQWVRTGGSGMPAFGDRLGAEDLQAVAAFVAAASRQN